MTKAVVIGGVSWNTMVFLDRFPQPKPQTVFASRSHTTIGGSGSGKALNLRALDAEVDLWALVGDDPRGADICDRFEAAGIRFHGEMDPLGTAHHVNLMDADGDRISIFVNGGSLDAEVDPEPMRQVMARADLVSITIMNHCRPFLPIAEEVDADIWIDIHDYDGVNPHHGAFIEAADMLIMSSVSMPQWRPFLEERIAAGTTVAIATHGAAGASGITEAAGWVDVSAPPAHVVDTNGAGDAFMAGFAMSWLVTADLNKAMEAGAERAALAVGSAELAPASRFV